MCIVSRYLPGHGIPPHVDSHSCCSDLLSLSLCSPVTMDFRDITDSSKAPSPVPIWLTQRSLLSLKGPARYTWSHGIVPRSSDPVPAQVVSPASPSQGLTLVNRGLRVSLTFRKTITEPCSCPYPEYCDRDTRGKPSLPRYLSAIMNLY